MGRKTWESIPSRHRPLKDRINIVVSSSTSLLGQTDVHVVESLDKALELAGTHGTNTFVIGGSELYKEAIERTNCRHVYITYIVVNNYKNNYKTECMMYDTYFPLERTRELFQEEEEEKEDIQWRSVGNVLYRFATLSRFSRNAR